MSSFGSKPKVFLNPTPLNSHFKLTQWRSFASAFFTAVTASRYERSITKKIPFLKTNVISPTLVLMSSTFFYFSLGIRCNSGRECIAATAHKAEHQIQISF